MSKFTIDETKAKLEGFVASLTAIQTSIEENGVAGGPVAAQSARMVAFACARAAGEMIQQLSGTVQYLSPAEKPADDLVGALVELAAEVSEAIMSQYGIEKEAVIPFLLETNDTMLPICETLVNTAVAKMAEADALTAAAAAPKTEG